MISDVETTNRPSAAVLSACRTWPDKVPTAAPVWCSIDLTAENEALEVPLSLENKLEYFKLLCDIGFKQIEVVSHACTEDDFALLRALADEGLIPDGVAVQIALPADTDVITRAFDILRNVRCAAVLLCAGTSPAFCAGQPCKALSAEAGAAVNAAALIRRLAESLDCADVSFGFSVGCLPEGRLEDAAEFCTSVMKAFGASKDRKIIVSLPCCSDSQQPNRYADAAEKFCRILPDREAAVISVRPLNGRGTAVAAAELALLAGAERVEGTLFSAGPRTGYADISCLALNLSSIGLNPGLDLSVLPAARDLLTGIAGMRAPAPIHSFTGDAAYILETQFGFTIPRAMQPEFSALVQKQADKSGSDISPDGIYELFESTYITVNSPYRLAAYSFDDNTVGDGYSEVGFSGKLYYNDIEYDISGSGNGPIDAFFNAISDLTISRYHFVSYSEHAVSSGSDSRAAAYIQLETPDGGTVFGVGLSHNIYLASIRGIICAINRGVALRSVRPAPRRTF